MKLRRFAEEMVIKMKYIFFDLLPILGCVFMGDFWRIRSHVIHHHQKSPFGRISLGTFSILRKVRSTSSQRCESLPIRKDGVNKYHYNHSETSSMMEKQFISYFSQIPSFTTI